MFFAEVNAEGAADEELLSDVEEGAFPSASEIAAGDTIFTPLGDLLASQCNVPIRRRPPIDMSLFPHTIMAFEAARDTDASTSSNSTASDAKGLTNAE